jgi:hypothetical protein
MCVCVCVCGRVPSYFFKFIFSFPDVRLDRVEHKQLRASHIYSENMLKKGPGNSIGFATGYGLDSPGNESRCGRDFPHLSRRIALKY